MLYNRDPCMPYAAVGRWNPVEPNFQHEYAMNNQVSPDVSRLKRFCTLQAADGVPDVECVDAPANKDLSSHGGSGAAAKCIKSPTRRLEGNGLASALLPTDVTRLGTHSPLVSSV